MLQPLENLVLLLVVSLPAIGCGHYHHHGHYHAHHDVEPAVAAVGLLAGGAFLAAEIEHTEHEREEQAPATYYNVVYVNPAPAPTSAPSRRDRAPTREKRPAFDARAARTALAKVDVADCRAEGAPRGYGHAKATFNPDGAASKVVVDAPAGLPEAAVQCIGDRLGAVRVAEFEGSLVTVGTTWFVP